MTWCQHTDGRFDSPRPRMPWGPVSHARISACQSLVTVPRCHPVPPPSSPSCPVVSTSSSHPGSRPPGWWRSEEHTSELQSRGHLVCRLLLEKKNKFNLYTYIPE